MVNYIKLELHYSDGSVGKYQAKGFVQLDGKLQIVELDGTHHDLDMVNIRIVYARLITR